MSKVNQSRSQLDQAERSNIQASVNTSNLLSLKTTLIATCTTYFVHQTQTLVEVQEAVFYCFFYGASVTLVLQKESAKRG